jgi:hypothetical protein
VASDILTHARELTADIEQTRRVQAAGALEPRLNEPVRQSRKQLARDPGPIRQRIGVYRYLL